MYSRIIKTTKTKSWFLFGPRQTGKSTFVRALLTKKDLYIDLLPQRVFLDYAKQPGRLREVILAHAKMHEKFVCAIDEIQKIPSLLDEVHALIESHKMRFILTGSSARKLRRGAANLLAGRAYTYHLFPLIFQELNEDFVLDRALTFGTLPALWQPDQEDAREFLRSYTETYLREEIAAEGLVRNIGPFSQFLDVAAANDGETVNYSNIARECSVSVKTVQQYYNILEDTFLTVRLSAWQRSERKRLVTHPRYYFFDPGITNILSHSLTEPLSSQVKGRRFEQFIVTQLMALIHYNRLDLQLFYWRTNHGAEVDLLIVRGTKILAALEIKSSPVIVREKIEGLKSFLQEHPRVPKFVLGINQTERVLDGEITVMNWDRFLQETLPAL